jgi:hypothetical protein
MKHGGEQKADTNLPDTLPHLLRGKIKINSKGFEYISATALGGYRPVSMFGHWNPCSSDNKSGGS